MLEEFGKKLSELGEAMSKDGKPLVIFVDELDRCRPDYAVELLERIKHLFAVENLLVVLSVDTQKLGHAASQVIGFSPEDTDGYLRRFIDLDYRLPTPNLDKLIRSKLKTFDLPEGYVQQRTSEQIAQLASLRGNSMRDVLLVIQRFTATAKSFPNKHQAFKQFLLIALIESHHDNETFAKVMIDPNLANERIRELKQWRDAKRGEATAREWCTRDYVLKTYGGWLIDFENKVLTDEEKQKMMQWFSQATQHDGSPQEFRPVLLRLINYAESFS